MKINFITNILTLILISSIVTSCSKDRTTTSENNKPQQQNNFTITERVIELTDKQVEQLDIKTIIVKPSKDNYVILAPGFVFTAPKGMYVVSAPVDGRVVNFSAYEGESVSKGEVIMEIESLEYGTLVADYLQAKAEETYNKNRFDRIKILVEKKISSQDDLDKANADFLHSQAKTKAAYAKLLTIGVSTQEIENFEKSKIINPRLKIISPIDGIIDNPQKIELGQAVKAYDNLISIIDNKEVLINGYINPEDATNLKIGDKVLVYKKDRANQAIESVISSINPTLDKENKSIVVNIIAKTKNGWPKPGENVKLDIIFRNVLPTISIPTSAVVYEGDNAIVFVRKSKNKFAIRNIKISKFYGDKLIVSDGLNENDEIAITQLFSLKALSRYEQFAE